MLNCRLLIFMNFNKYSFSGTILLPSPCRNHCWPNCLIFPYLKENGTTSMVHPTCPDHGPLLKQGTHWSEMPWLWPNSMTTLKLRWTEKRLPNITHLFGLSSYFAEGRILYSTSYAANGTTATLCHRNIIRWQWLCTNPKCHNFYITNNHGSGQWPCDPISLSRRSRSTVVISYYTTKV